MSQFAEEAPETLPDWNAILAGGCCCEMPECPVPTKECQSLSANAEPEGWLQNAAGVWTLYSKTIYRTTYSYSETVTDTHPAGGTYTAISGSGSGTHDSVQERIASGSGLVNATVDVGGCQYNSPTTSTYCNGSGSWSRTGYDPWVLYDGGVIHSSGVDTATEESATYTDVGGESNGAGGFYAACWFRKDYTFVEWDNCHSLTPGYCDGYPTSTTTNTTSYANTFDGWPFGTTTSNANVYENGVLFPAWVTATRTYMDGLMNFATPANAACIGTSCLSSHVASEVAWQGYYVALTLQKARFKWVIPDTFEGTYFKITWDIVFFPTSGDPVAVTTDATWEWTGPGDPEDADSWKSGWYEIAVPTQAGQNRVVNVRFECYTSAAFGNLPQVTGEAVEIPPP